MTIQAFVEQVTMPAPGTGVQVSKLRRAYERSHGPVSRTRFVCDLAAANYPITVVGDRTILVGRALAPQPAAA
jgi:hypothetical protein